MKIALCSKGTFSLQFGATKNRIELAESLKKLNWETTLVDNDMLGIPLGEKFGAARFNLALKDYLVKNAYQYDVVLYEYDTLPFDRRLFNRTTLFVARPAILDYHLLSIKFRFNLKTRLSNIYRGTIKRLTGRYKEKSAFYKQIDYSLEQCDLIQVQNKKDRRLLIERGFREEKIIIVPNGISAERIERFNGYQPGYTEPFTVAYVGTFDFRKGAMDFPHILEGLKKKSADIKMKLLGTSGMFSTTEEVLRFFPRKYHSSIQVVPKFNANDLPELLSDCQIGVFPSYLESFGFGALEMMCSGLPVVAYDSPGPSDFILSDLLVPAGDHAALTRKIILLFENKVLLEQKSKEAKKTVIERYCWDDIAVDAAKHYCTHLEKTLIKLK
jgi:glycosyltransferase involved in cell wall biosynthesis